MSDCRLRCLRQKNAHAVPAAQTSCYQHVGKTVGEPSKIVKGVPAASLVFIDEHQGEAAGAVRVPVADVSADVENAGDLPAKVLDQVSIAIGWHQQFDLPSARPVRINGLLASCLSLGFLVQSVKMRLRLSKIVKFCGLTFGVLSPSELAIDLRKLIMRGFALRVCGGRFRKILERALGVA